jgi:hypothetical protein
MQSKQAWGAPSQSSVALRKPKENMTPNMMPNLPGYAPVRALS